MQKHKSEDPAALRAMYYPNLRLYAARGDTSKQSSPKDAVFAFLLRFGRKAAISMVIYLLSYLPYVGRFVLPAASFCTFNSAVGPVPAMVIFGSGVFLPRRYLVMFLQSYFSSRSLMRELVSWPTLTWSWHLKLICGCSLNLISHVYALRKSKNVGGSMIERVCSSDLAWGSTSSSRFHFLVSSSMVLRRPPPHISLPKSPIHHQRLLIARSLLRVRRDGPTSTNSSGFRSQTWMRIMLSQTSRSRTRSRHNLQLARSSPRLPNALYCHCSMFRIDMTC